MEVYFKQEDEHLPYILSSAVWHYLQYIDKVLNSSNDNEIVQHFLMIQRLIKEQIIDPVKKPIPAEEFKVHCHSRDIAQLLIEILHHYLEETKEILRTIEDPIITKKCLNDMEIIENQLITAIVST